MKMNSLHEIHQQQLADQRRGRYVRVSDVDRRQLIDTYKRGEDFIALAKKLNIKRSTARSILRTYIDEGRISAKQRAGTRLRFITEDEAEIIREMKRRHPLITIGQIQMRLQKTSNRVLSKASISRILTNSIRLGKRAKRSHEMGDDDVMQEGLANGQEDFVPGSSDEGTGGGLFYIDEEEDDDEDEDDEKMTGEHNLEDFQRFMVQKSNGNGDESMANGGATWNGKEGYENMYEKAYPIRYPNLSSEDDDDESSEMDGNESKSPVDDQNDTAPNYVHMNGDTSTATGHQTSVKSEPVCVFLNQNYDSSDSEQQPTTIEEKAPKAPLNLSSSVAHRRIKICPLCGEKNFSRLSHHLTLVHQLSRQQSLALLAHPDSTNNSSVIATVSGSSPNTNTSNHYDQSPQPTPININTNNQQIKPTGLTDETIGDADNNNNNLLPSTRVSPNEQPLSTNFASNDGKKRLLCPKCDTWVLNLTDHLIKKHHLLSKQERLPYLRSARNRQALPTNEKTSSVTSFLVNSERSSPIGDLHKDIPSQAFQIHEQQQQQYQNMMKKYRKKMLNQTQPSSSDLSSPPITTNTHPNLMTMNSIQSLIDTTSSARLFSMPKLNGNSSLTNKDIQQMAIHQKFEQKLTVFRQQFSVAVAIQNSLMQQMELLQRSFASIEDEWNDMRKDIATSIS